MKFIEAGQSIKIEDPNKNSNSLQSRVLRVEQDRMYISLPNDKSVFENKFEEGDDVYCTVTTKFGIILFNSVIIEVKDDYLEIDYNPDEYEFFQRRKYIRINVEFPATLEYKGEYIRVRTVDLGGGGIKFVSDKELPIDVYMNMRIILNEDESFVRICGKILKGDYCKANEYLFFFTDINENTRTKIIKKCIEVQASQVRKTLDDYESGNKRY